MNDIGAAEGLALSGFVSGAATVYFFIFWTWFDFWRKHRVLTYMLMASTFVGATVLALSFREWTLAGRFDMPIWIQSAGWGAIAFATVFGWVADRQIGLRVRSFTPFFQQHGRIKLRTTGAYGIVRHPIYAAGRVFVFGVFLVSGYPAALAGWLLFGLGSIWFTKQEEKRLLMLLEDPAEYERYRQRVPALFPLLRPRRPTV